MLSGLGWRQVLGEDTSLDYLFVDPLEPINELDVD